MTELIDRLLAGMKQVKDEAWIAHQAGQTSAEELAVIVSAVVVVEEIIRHMGPVERAELARQMERSGRALDFFKALMGLRTRNAVHRAPVMECVRQGDDR